MMRDIDRGHRTSSPEGDQAECSWVVAFLHGTRANGICHVAGQNSADALRGFVDLASQTRREAGNSFKCFVRVNWHFTPEEVILVQTA